MKETVIVTAPMSRRRAGYRFGPHPVEIARGELTDAQLEALKSDPFLAVSVRPVEAEKVVASAKKAAPPPAPARAQDQVPPNSPSTGESESKPEGGGGGEAGESRAPIELTGEAGQPPKPGKAGKGGK